MPQYRVKLHSDYTPLRARGHRQEVVELRKEDAEHKQHRLLNILDSAAFSDAEVKTRSWISNTVTVEMPPGIAMLLAQDSQVESVTEDMEFSIHWTPGIQVEDQAANSTYGLEMVRAPETWANHGVDGTGVTVAVIDTGTTPEHESLQHAWASGWAHFNEGRVIGTTPYDGHDHGTHVSGTVVGNDASNMNIGVAPGADLYAVKVLDDTGRGNSSDVDMGMEWTADPTADDGTQLSPVHVVNMSLGGAGAYDLGTSEAIRVMLAADIILLASIGNDGTGTSGQPGHEYEGLGIGAVDTAGSAADFSGGKIIGRSNYTTPLDGWPTHWRKPDICGPGVGVYSSVPSGGYASYNGTSMSSPHLAGVACLVRAANPSLDTQQVRRILLDTARWDDRHRPRHQEDIRYGYGVADAYEAVRSVL